MIKDLLEGKKARDIILKESKFERCSGCTKNFPLDALHFIEDENDDSNNPSGEYLCDACYANSQPVEVGESKDTGTWEKAIELLAKETSKSKIWAERELGDFMDEVASKEGENSFDGMSAEQIVKSYMEDVK